MLAIELNTIHEQIWANQPKTQLDILEWLLFAIRWALLPTLMKKLKCIVGYARHRLVHELLGHTHISKYHTLNQPTVCWMDVCMTLGDWHCVYDVKKANTNMYVHKVTATTHLLFTHFRRRSPKDERVGENTDLLWSKSFDNSGYALRHVFWHWTRGAQLLAAEDNGSYRPCAVIGHRHCARQTNNISEHMAE